MDIGTALLPLGIIPALFILYIILGGYERKFKNAYIFLTFIGGVVLGTVIFLIELWWIFGLSEEALHSVPIIITLSFCFLFLEQISKLAVLNMRRFQNDEGVPLYGASLGLGFASPSGAVLLGFMDYFKIMEESIFSLGGIFLVILAISILLISCTTGIWIGIAVKKKERVKGLLLTSLAGIVGWIAILLQVPFKPVSLYANIIICIALGYAIFIYLYAYRRTLPFHLMGRKMKKKILEKRIF
ncbi:MAG: hypothetical protein FE048_01610 [Thermoplasmata archaeon]|nr:MAG: hypothetical protein FE048_01610 [Thermoplasmata archaeon]